MLKYLALTLKKSLLFFKEERQTLIKQELSYNLKYHDTKSLSNILIVDDDISCLSTLELLLKSESYNVFKAANGFLALEYLNNHFKVIDLILLDLMMPGINGFDILDTLEKDDYLKNIPIIIQSGIIDEEIRLKISNNSVKGFIVKPYTKQELIETICNISINH